MIILLRLGGSGVIILLRLGEVRLRVIILSRLGGSDLW